MHEYKTLRMLALFSLLFCCVWTTSQQQGESPEIVAKWQRFVKSLSANQRREFDRLHQEAGRLDSAELARRTQKFMSTLSAEQKRSYAEIQQRGGGGTGGGGDDWERQRKTQGQQAKPSPSSGSSAKGGFSPQGFDRWINNPELAESTRNSLRKIKEIFSRSMDPVEKCQRIQRILQGIGSGDKKRMQMPAQLLNFDCSQERGGGGVENLLTSALTNSDGGRGK